MLNTWVFLIIWPVKATVTTVRCSRYVESQCAYLSRMCWVESSDMFPL